MPLLQTLDVSVRFGGVTALDQVSIDAEAGCVTGLIGPNGAGKTTIFNVITGLQSPTAGQVLIDGDDVTSLPVHRRARLGVARTFQRLEIFGSLTVRENIQVAGEIRRRWSRSRFDVTAQTDEILDRIGLHRVADAPANTLPTGLARLTELGRALASQPRLLLLDEPGSGLDTHESEEFGRLLGELAHDGMTVLLVEHDMDLIMDVCDWIHVLDFGVHIAKGAPEEIRSNTKVQEAYLGTGDETVDPRRAEPRRSDDRDRGGHVIPPAIQLIGMRAAYGRIEILCGIDLTVPAGTLFALLGPNGAGKTTTLKVIDGRHDASSGCVHIAGQHVNGTGADKLARAGVCSIPEGRGIFPNLSVEENLKIMTYGRSNLTAADVQEKTFNRFPILSDRRKQVAGTLSGGQQQMLAISRAVVTDPSLLLVDELSMGLAPLVVRELYDVLGQLAADGMTVLLVEQFARTALAIADYAAVLVHGRVQAVGQPADMQDVAGAYLGAAS